MTLEAALQELDENSALIAFVEAYFSAQVLEQLAIDLSGELN